MATSLKYVGGIKPHPSVVKLSEDHPLNLKDVRDWLIYNAMFKPNLAHQAVARNLETQLGSVCCLARIFLYSQAAFSMTMTIVSISADSQAQSTVCKK